MTNNTKIATMMFGAALSALVACGGAQKSGGGSGSVGKSGGDVAPPDIKKTDDVTQVAKVAKREVSKDAKADYAAALAFFNDNDKDGKWSESACRGAADKFKSVVNEHSDIVEAQFMVGLSFERCGLLGDAEKAYQTATQMKGDANKIAMAMSNLGEIYYKAGKLDAAKTQWDNAIKANGKLV
ncbi:MAG: Tetratricopeptide 2 repeat protein, partial [Myxococcales bacterium]|nr:Tetratricopeptide 2 repeat protein [Myxococcales bacterium]